MLSTENATLLDATGMLCPLPVLKARKALKSLQANAVLEVLATDPGAVADFQSFCEVQGHTLDEWSQDGEVYRFLIRKG